jgi:hypothetical protein
MTVTGKTLREALQLNAVVPHPLDLWPYRHTTMIPNQSFEWSGTDHETLYKRNLRNLPENWIYRTKKITYNYNEQGLRMPKSVYAVDKDYILFSGTSYTQGLGVAEEDRFCNRVSAELGLDFIPHGGPTFTIKTNAISFFNFLDTDMPLPKIFVMEYHKTNCWTYYSENNFVHIHNSHGTLKHLPEGKQFTNHIESYKKIAETDHFLHESNLYRNMMKATCKRLGIKFVEVSFDEPTEPFITENGIKRVEMSSHSDDINYCFGRDVRVRAEGYYSHPGIGLHGEAAELILSQV